MGLTEDQVRALLTVCVGYDNRRPGQVNVLAWQEAAERGGWTFEIAQEAIHDHYAKSEAFLLPAVITAYVKRQREHEQALRDQEARRRALEAPRLDWTSMWRAALERTKPERVRRRAAVLAHADLRQRLTEPPIGFEDAQQWNGYVPPADSPRARAIRDIVDTARERMENTQ